MNFYKLDHEATMKDIENFNYPNSKLGIIIHIENSDGEILLQQRGVKSRDENGLYENIGGKFDKTDTSFKTAILRELYEEAGREINITIGQSIGIYHCYKNSINWIFVIYFGKYLNGKFKIMEPDKCQGYHFFTYEEALDSNLVTESCKYLIKSIKEHI